MRQLSFRNAICFCFVLCFKLWGVPGDYSLYIPEAVNPLAPLERVCAFAVATSGGAPEFFSARNASHRARTIAERTYKPWLFGIGQLSADHRRYTDIYITTDTSWRLNRNTSAWRLVAVAEDIVRSETAGVAWQVPSEQITPYLQSVLDQLGHAPEAHAVRILSPSGSDEWMVQSQDIDIRDDAARNVITQALTKTNLPQPLATFLQQVLLFGRPDRFVRLSFDIFRRGPSAEVDMPVETVVWLRAKEMPKVRPPREIAFYPMP